MKTNGLTATYRPEAKTSFRSSHRKENNGFYAEYAALYADSTGDDREMFSPVVLRLYWPGEVCYACLWVNGREVHTSGSASAGGGGYCKASAAAHSAIENAGFTLSRSIDGAGTERIKDAVLAIADALGYSGARLHYSHA